MHDRPGASREHAGAADPVGKGRRYQAALEGISAALVRADAYDVLHLADDDLAVTDLSGARGLHQRLDDRLFHVVGDQDLETHLRDELDAVLGTPVQLRVAALATEALDLGDRHPVHSHSRQGFLHLVDLVRLYDRVDLLHRLSPTPL